MTEHYLTVIRDGKETVVPFSGTPLISEVLAGAGFLLNHPCGGRGICGRCAVRAEGAFGEGPEGGTDAGKRLSCMTRLTGDATVFLPAAETMAAEGCDDAIAPSEESGLGVAVDIGTTTVAMAVYRLNTGECLWSDTCVNPQRTAAADVMGRIGAALQGRGAELQQLIRQCIRDLLDRSGMRAEIRHGVITGNTTMLYLLCGYSPDTLAGAPYQADHLFGETCMLDGIPYLLPRCMSAFVGADITCAVYDSGMMRPGETNLLADIGTNGELALWKEGKLYTASTAAGPAFEGVGIGCGCAAVPGAVEGVELRAGEYVLRTIENKAPIGLCGSGILDAVACFLEAGEIDETGETAGDYLYLTDRIRLGQEDVRQIQLAKAAIAAGIRTLLQETGTDAADIDHFYIAGGFGKHLNLRSAGVLGLFPGRLCGKAILLGNAALRGAAAMLTGTGEEAARNPLCIENLQLGGNPVFNRYYIDCMLLNSFA